MHVISAHVHELGDSCLLAQGILGSESSFLCTMMHTQSSKSPPMSGDNHPQKAGKAHWAVEEEAMLLRQESLSSCTPLLTCIMHHASYALVLGILSQY